MSGLAAGGGKISVLGTGGGYEWEDAVKGPGTTAAISHSLVAFYNVRSSVRSLVRNTADELGW